MPKRRHSDDGYQPVDGAELEENDEQQNVNVQIDQKQQKRLKELIGAIKIGNVKTVEEILCEDNKYANYEYQDTTPLVEAINAKNPSIDILNLLIEHGVNTKQKDPKHKEPPIFKAIARNNPVILDILLKTDVDINGRHTVALVTPLHQSILRDNLYAVCQIVKHEKIEINIQDANGDTALHVAVDKDKCPFVFAIATASPYIQFDIKNKNGLIPMKINTPFSLRSQDLLQKCIDTRTKIRKEGMSKKLAVVEIENLRKFEEKKLNEKLPPTIHIGESYDVYFSGNIDNLNVAGVNKQYADQRQPDNAGSMQPISSGRPGLIPTQSSEQNYNQPKESTIIDMPSTVSQPIQETEEKVRSQKMLTSELTNIKNDNNFDDKCQNAMPIQNSSNWWEYDPTTATENMENYQKVNEFTDLRLPDKINNDSDWWKNEKFDGSN